ALASEITVEDLTRSQSLYAVLRERLEIQPKEATEIIRSEPASSDDARLLGIQRGTALLCIYRWTTDQRGAPMEYVRSAAPGDRYQYVIKLHQ
ncbi:MAG: UTRA domain-containing protein, partial [Propionibacteriaceae bacterium]|nr:UTRA domain-containing protein [Propionibacteriaceae bacterium]